MTTAERVPTLDALKPYPAYKDSGMQNVPVIPTHWEARRNHALFFQRVERGMEELQMLSVTQNRGVVRQEELLGQRKDTSPPDKSLYKHVLPNDIVYNKMRMWQGAVGLSAYEGIVSPAYIVVAPREGATYAPAYIAYQFKSQPFIEEFGRWSHGIADDQNSLRYEDFKALYTIYPPEAEQATIATFLDHETARIDVLVREQEQLLDDLADKRRSTITGAVTSGIRPRLAQRTDVPWMPLIPQHWKVIPLKHLAQFQGGLTPPDEPQFWNGDVPWVTPKDMKRPVITDTEDKVTAAAVTEGCLKLFKPGALLMVVRSGILRHTVPVAVNATSVTVNQDMKVLQPIAEVRARFLYYFFEGLGPSLLPVIQKVGTTVESINMAALRNLQVAIPPIADQDEIMEHLDHVLAQIDDLAAEVRANIEDMKLLRSTLITAATTGKIDVRDWRPG